MEKILKVISRQDAKAAKKTEMMQRPGSLGVLGVFARNLLVPARRV
jgi:hypothetical protein